MVATPALTPPSPVTRISSGQLAAPAVPKRTESPGIAPSGRKVRVPGGLRMNDLRVESVNLFMGSTFFRRGSRFWFQFWFQFWLDAPGRPYSAVDTYPHQIK